MSEKFLLKGENYFKNYSFNNITNGDFLINLLHSNYKRTSTNHKKKVQEK